MRQDLGTVHEYVFDKLGRRTADVIAPVGNGIDGAVRRIEWAYNSRGLTESVTSYDAPTGGGIVNQVTYEYNHFMQLTSEPQSHSGAVT